MVKVYAVGRTEPIELWLKGRDGPETPVRFELATGGCIQIDDATADMLRAAVTDPYSRERLDRLRADLHRAAVKRLTELSVKAALWLAGLAVLLRLRGRRRRRRLARLKLPD